MNSKTVSKRDLKHLILQWKQKAREYEEAMLTEENFSARRRYEGITTGLRWCYEDLATLLEENSNES